MPKFLVFLAIFFINIKSLMSINCFDCKTLEDCTFPLVPSAICDTKAGQNQCLSAVLFNTKNNSKSYIRECWKGGCEQLKANPGLNTKVLYCKSCEQSNCNDDDLPRYYH